MCPGEQVWGRGPTAGAHGLLTTPTPGKQRPAGWPVRTFRQGSWALRTQLCGGQPRSSLRNPGTRLPESWWLCFRYSGSSLKAPVRSALFFTLVSQDKRRGDGGAASGGTPRPGRPSSGPPDPAVRARPSLYSSHRGFRGRAPAWAPFLSASQLYLIDWMESLARG